MNLKKTDTIRLTLTIIFLAALLSGCGDGGDSGDSSSSDSDSYTTYSIEVTVTGLPAKQTVGLGDTLGDYWGNPNNGSYSYSVSAADDATIVPLVTSQPPGIVCDASYQYSVGSIVAGIVADIIDVKVTCRSKT